MREAGVISTEDASLARAYPLQLATKGICPLDATMERDFLRDAAAYFAKQKR